MLQICDWAALPGRDGEALGAPVREDAIPKALRRRMPDFMRRAVGCTLAVMHAEAELVFASRYGDLSTTVSLLEAIAASELLSPTAFAFSVHNAVPGMIDQVAGVRHSHTAVAAGESSLAAGLLEAWLRLATGEAREVVLAYADLPPPLPFASNSASAWFGAARLRLSDDDGTPIAAPGDAAGFFALIGAGHRAFALPTAH